MTPAVRATHRPSLDHAFGTGDVKATWLVLTFAALAGSAAAASVQEAQRIVDRAEPLRCVILVLEERLERAHAGTEESASLSAEISAARKKLKFHYLATMDELHRGHEAAPLRGKKGGLSVLGRRCRAVRGESAAGRARPVTALARMKCATSARGPVAPKTAMFKCASEDPDGTVSGHSRPASSGVTPPRSASSASPFSCPPAPDASCSIA
jgi:hypothetical protein